MIRRREIAKDVRGVVVVEGAIVVDAAVDTAVDDIAAVEEQKIIRRGQEGIFCTRIHCISELAVTGGHGQCFDGADRLTSRVVEYVAIKEVMELERGAEMLLLPCLTRYSQPCFDTH